MSANTKIEWADHTFNPWTGCTKVSPGCDHCYAEGWAKRSGHVQWGPGAERRRTSAANWRLPVKWDEQSRVAIVAWKAFRAACPGVTDAQLEAEGYIKPRRPRVFCASLADVFDNEVPAQWRIDLLKLIDETPHLDWLLLTKRIGNAAGMLEAAFRAVHHGRQGWADNYLPNVWLGATITNQAEADRDVPKLLATPAAKRFLSMEPLLGPVDLTRITFKRAYGTGLLDALSGQMRGHVPNSPLGTGPRIDWVIVGGESGPHARPMHPDWARSLCDQCNAAGVPFFMKQMTKKTPIPDDLLIREIPHA